MSEREMAGELHVLAAQSSSLQDPKAGDKEPDSVSHIWTRHKPDWLERLNCISAMALQHSDPPSFGIDSSTIRSASCGVVQHGA